MFKLQLLATSVLLLFLHVTYSQSIITAEKIQITDGASPNFVLKTDGQGNATWVNPMSIVPSSTSYWTLNGSNIYNNNNGNVGLGITAPSQKLEVQGNVRSTGTFLALGQSGYPDFWSAGGNALTLSNGYIGTNGSFRSSWMWNGYRNSNTGWTSLGVNGFNSAAGIELGHDGISFRTSDQLPSGLAPDFRMIITPAGNVGIGSSAPAEKLQLNGKAIINEMGLGTTNTPVLRVGTPRSNSGTSNMLFLAGFNSTNYWKFLSRLEADGVETMTVRHGSINLTTNSGNIMTYRDDGKVGVGVVTSYAGNYKFYVDEGILTERVKIASMGSAEWADYVFDETYKLSSLEEIEEYVKTNKHLPNVPSADDIEKNGYELQKMDAKLLEKIEELYLLTIELNKDKIELERQNNLLKQSIVNIQNQHEVAITEILSRLEDIEENK